MDPSNPEDIIDAVLDWLSLQLPRWSGRTVVVLQSGTTTEQSGTQDAFLESLAASVREEIEPALESGELRFLPVLDRNLQVHLRKLSLGKLAWVLERFMDQSEPRPTVSSEAADASSDQAINLQLFCIVAIARNWCYPVNVLDADPRESAHIKNNFLRIMGCLLQLWDLESKTADEDRSKPSPTKSTTDKDLSALREPLADENPPTLAELAAELPALKLRMARNYAIGRFLHDARLLAFVKHSKRAQECLDSCMVEYAHLKAIQSVVEPHATIEERSILDKVAADAGEMLASLQMLDRTPVFPVDFLSTAKLLNDGYLGSKTARLGRYDDLIEPGKATGYMLKMAPLRSFRRSSESVRELLEVPHRTTYFIGEIAKDIPGGTCYIDITAASSGLHIIAANSKCQASLSCHRQSLSERVRNLVSGRITELKRCGLHETEAGILPQEPGDNSDRKWIARNRAIFYGVDSSGKWLRQTRDIRQYVTHSEWQSTLREFASVLGELSPWFHEHDIHHLVINPDQALNFVPWALLPHTQGATLFERMRVSLVPTIPHLINAVLKTNRLECRDRDRLVMLVDRHSGDQHFAAEERLIRERFSGREIAVHYSDELDRSAFEEDVLGADIFHVCTHAAFEGGRLEQSGIRLADGDCIGLSDIAQMRFQRHSLVFLSACETAASDVSDRFRRSSISQSFLDAGAGTVIATKWEVDGRAMALLASKFYQLLLESPRRSFLDALHVAQMWLSRCSREEAAEHLGRPIVTTCPTPYADECFWAAVELWGCWD